MPFAPPNLLISLESLGSNPTLSAITWLSGTSFRIVLLSRCAFRNMK